MQSDKVEELEIEEMVSSSILANSIIGSVDEQGQTIVIEQNGMAALTLTKEQLEGIEMVKKVKQANLASVNYSAEATPTEIKQDDIVVENKSEKKEVAKFPIKLVVIAALGCVLCSLSAYYFYKKGKAKK